jgi:hypothetical protein
MRWAPLALPLLLLPAIARADEPPAHRFAVGVNVLQPALYGIASSFFEESLLLPVPIEAHVHIHDRWGLTGTLQYRRHKDGDLSVNGLGLFVGPRLRLTGRDLDGLYATLKVGLAFNGGRDYFQATYNRLDFVLQPELGYAVILGPVYLGFGAGFEGQIPVFQDRSGTWTWNGLGLMVTSYLPVANLTVAFVY